MRSASAFGSAIRARLSGRLFRRRSVLALAGLVAVAALASGCGYALVGRGSTLPPEVKSENVPFKVLVPAFVTSELKSAFQIGFLVFVPFLIIDMIVASVLMSLGMMMLSPVLVALPFKLMLFVLADGWNLLLGSLAASFVT